MIAAETRSLAPGPAEQPSTDDAALISRITSLFGAPLVAALPSISADDDSSAAFERLLRALRDAPVVLFHDIPGSRLDDFFRLRLQQVLRQEGPLPSLSVIALAPDRADLAVAGFPARFRSSWPFARCLFVTRGFDLTPKTANALGHPVSRLDVDTPAPAPCGTFARAGQRVAVQIQPMWKRCGSTTAFQNQVEQLVDAGFLTVRVFTDPSVRRGPTLTRRLGRILPENAVHAGAHVNVIAVPEEVAATASTTGFRALWAADLNRQSACLINDQAARQAIAQADSVIANHMHTVGLALTLAPSARLLLDVHDDREAAARQSALSNGSSAPRAEAIARHMASLQAAILAIPDVCTYVSQTEAQHMGRFSRRRAIVLPRVYAEPVVASQTQDYDLFLVGDRHMFNIISLRWFIENVWRPYLQQANLSAAVVGRIGEAMDPATCSAPGLRYTGFTENLETFRASCRLTVVPDRAGTGIAVKLLTTLAAGHPMVTTTTALRGLDPAISGLIPAFDDPEAMAADILGLLRNPDRLEERRRLVRRMQAAIETGPSYPDCLAAIGRPTAGECAERHARWAAIVAPAHEAAAAPLRLHVGAVFPLSGTAWDHQVLAAGWHEAERWGRWTDGTDATLRITLDAPAAHPLALEIDTMPSSLRPRLTIAADGQRLTPIRPGDGPHVVHLPPEAVIGKDAFTIDLHVDEALCPAAQEDSPDDRVLGIGVRSIRLLSRQPARIHLGQTIRLSLGSAPWDLQLDGWHRLEDWGCWTAGAHASCAVALAEPCTGRVELEMDLLPARSGATVTLSVNQHMLPAVVPLAGRNRWALPVGLTAGQERLVLGLTVSETSSPPVSAADDRIMGIGVRSLTLRALDPLVIQVGDTVALTAAQLPDRLLRSGWHQPEPWGCWTSSQEARLHLSVPQPLAGRFRLTLALTPPPTATALTIVVNGQPLPPVFPRNGLNDWLLPAEYTEGRTELEIDLRLAGTFNPAAAGIAADDRVLGIGVRSIALHTIESPFCALGETVRVASACSGRGVLGGGWHTVEPWGCWSAGNDASVHLTFEAPLAGALILELDLVPPLLAQPVTVAIGEMFLPKRWIRDGINRWDLPRICTDGRTKLAVRLMLETVARPLDVQGSTDDRHLGVGIRSVRLVPSPLQ